MRDLGRRWAASLTLIVRSWIANSEALNRRFIQHGQSWHELRICRGMRVSLTNYRPTVDKLGHNALNLMAEAAPKMTGQDLTLT